MDLKYNERVISPRFLEKLRSGIGVSAESVAETLVTFATDDDLDKFVNDQATANLAVGAAGERQFRIKRVARSIRTVTLEIRLDVLTSLSNRADDMKISSIDENFRVRMSLDQTRAIELTDFAWNHSYRGEGMTVAVLDTGIDVTHPDLTSVVSARSNFTQEQDGDLVGHGTHVGSIVAGQGVVDSTKSGLAKNARLLDGKVLGADGFGTASDVIAGVEWAVQKKADVINMSLGAPGPYDGTDPLSRAADWAVSQGVVVCAAAGNCGPSGNPLVCPAVGEKTIQTPGCAATVITVGAIDKSKALAGYSSQGPSWGNLPKPDVITVGSDIVGARARNTSLGTPVNDSYTRASGTSMATPVCSALVALYLQAARAAGRTPTPAEVKQSLKNSASPLMGVSPGAQGAGFVDAQDLLTPLVTATPTPTPTTPTPTTPTPTPTTPTPTTPTPTPTTPTPTPVLPGTILVVDVFSLADGGVHRAGATRDWVLKLRNSSTSQGVTAVVAAFAPSAAITVTPGNAPYGDLGPGASASQRFGLKATSAGTFPLSVTIQYRLGADPQPKNIQVQVNVTIAAAVTSPTQTSVKSTLTGAVNRLLSLQEQDGSWHGDIMFDAFTNGMYAILHKVIGLDGTPTAILNWIETHRSGLDDRGVPNGTWGIVDDPSVSFLEATVICEIALEIWGRGIRQEVWDYINSQQTAALASALTLTDPFCQMWAVLASDFAPPEFQGPYYDIANMFAPPIEMLLAPRVLTVSVPRLFAAWAVDAIPALMVISTIRRNPNPPLLKQVILKKAESWLLRAQNEDGSWYCTFLPTIAGVMAMHFLGYNNQHPVIQRAIGFLKSRMRPDGYLMRFRLPVWDTSLAVLALKDAGLAADHPNLRLAGTMLLDSQDPVTGGTAFQKENPNYPDTDDASVAVLALSEITMGDQEGAKATSIQRALRWLIYMQGDDGGWSSFTKNQATMIRNQIPFGTNDPPTADVTGHVLSALQYADRFNLATEARQAVSNALGWLQKEQMSRGEWYGRWGLTFTYGTTAVLRGLNDVQQLSGAGISMDQPFIRQGINYLLTSQRSDGGWGEGYATYYNFAAKDDGHSTVEQTAWSLLGLLAVPSTPSIKSAIDRGVQFLVDQYDPSTGWGWGQYTVGALWIYKNTYYPLLWGVWALGFYLQSQEVSS